MKGLYYTVLAALIGCGNALAAESETEAATAAATAWVQLIDSGDYANSWKSAATPFQQQISSDGWADMLRINREPLGAVKSRHLANAQYTTQLPGAPDGHYVVVEFDTEFSSKQHAIETLTPMLENGQWRIGGYYVK